MAASTSTKYLDFTDNVSFEKVSATDGVPTTEFLQASETLVKLFDILGPTAFGAVISDMNGNIKKIRDRQLAVPEKSATLQELVLSEQPEKKKTATEGLLWLLRGLDFTSKALRHNLENPTEELATSFQHSYDGTLKKHHNFVIRGVFTVALKATPYRKEFYEKIGHNEADPADTRLANWLDSLERVVARMQGFYAENNNFGF